MSFVIFLSCLAGFIIPHLVFSSNQSVSFHLHNVEFQQINAVSLASLFYSRKIQLPSNYVNELSFLSLSLVSFSLSGITFSVASEFTAILLLKNATTKR